MARKKLLCICQKNCVCALLSVCFTVNTCLIKTQIQREGKYMRTFHFARSPPRQAGCLVGTPSYLVYLQLEVPAQGLCLCQEERNFLEPLPDLINSCKLFFSLYFSYSNTLISNTNYFASKSNLLNQATAESRHLLGGPSQNTSIRPNK